MPMPGLTSTALDMNMGMDTGVGTGMDTDMDIAGRQRSGSVKEVTAIVTIRWGCARAVHVLAGSARVCVSRVCHECWIGDWCWRRCGRIVSYGCMCG